MDTMSDESVEGRILAHRQILGAIVAELSTREGGVGRVGELLQRRETFQAGEEDPGAVPRPRHGDRGGAVGRDALGVRGGRAPRRGRRRRLADARPGGQAGRAGRRDEGSASLPQPTRSAFRSEGDSPRAQAIG